MDYISLSRRTLLIAPLFAGVPALFAASATDAKVTDLTFEFEDFLYRAPYKFGGREVDRVTLLNVRCRLALRSGKSAEGAASMPLGNIWSFPAVDTPYDATLNAMKVLAERIARITRSHTEYAHPFDINHDLEPEYLKAAAEVSAALKLTQPIP